MFYIAKRYFKGHSGGVLPLWATESDVKSMTKDGKQKMPTLEGDKALYFWRQGPDAWNNWIEEHPGWNISFAGVDFSTERSYAGNLSFAGYHFGDGDVDFSGATFGDRSVEFFNATFGDGNLTFIGTTFGDGDVSFLKVTFGNGNVDFSDTSFGYGTVNFSRVTFGTGNIDFSETSFGHGDVDFFEAIFGNGDVDFSKATFDDGDVDFRCSTFGNGKADFSEVKFGNGNVNFSEATFGDGEVAFFRATFGNGDVTFAGANFGNGDLTFLKSHFGDGNVKFSEATFDRGDVKFSEATFGNCDVDFDKAAFSDCSVNFHATTSDKGYFRFSKTTFDNSNLKFSHASLNTLIFRPKSIGYIEAQGLSIQNLALFVFPSSSNVLKYFDMQGASFNGPLFLMGDLDIILDLRASRSSHQVELSDLNVKLRRVPQSRNWFKKFFAVAEYPEDAARLRRLKEIAETNKDHQAALRFSADENRARRWIETSWFGSVLDMAFSACSNYGQSILRPFVALFVLAVASMGFYKKQAVTTDVEWWTAPGWGQSAHLSISNSLPFLPQSRGLREGALDALYPGDPSFWINALMIGQGTFSFVFLFLIGLGLRNRFRL